MELEKKYTAAQYYFELPNFDYNHFYKIRIINIKD